MSNVVQAKCPHCHNVLRIPSDWLARAMRCKHCKQTFQAKANTSSSTAANTAAAPKTSAPTPVAMPANPVPSALLVALPAPVPVALPAAPAAPPPSGGDPFGFDTAEPDADGPATTRRRSRGHGTLILAAMLLLFLGLGAGGTGYIVYKAMNTPSAREEKIAKAKEGGKSESPSRTSSDRVSTDGQPDRDADKSRKVSIPSTDDGKKKETDKDKDKKKIVTLPPTDKKKTVTPPPTDKKKIKGPVFTSDPFPRRALLISVESYLFLNRVHYGSGQGAVSATYPGSSTEAVRDRLTRPPMNFPSSQIVELSDGIPQISKTAKSHSTQKSVIETTIKDFVDTSRTQDRVIVLFAGHGYYHEETKSAYLVPSDGELKKPETMVPLKWVYDQLAKCPAQQKLLILDLFRFSPSRGFEGATAGVGEEGAMSEEFDKELENPPAGVQVWCACVKEQSSTELEAGSAFLQAFCHAMQKRVDGAGISNPSQPLPIETLVGEVNTKLKDLLASTKRTQVSRLTGKAGTVDVAYNKDEPLPARLALKPPTVGGAKAADKTLVKSILDELDIPPVRDSRKNDRNLLDPDKLPAFAASKLDSFKTDGNLSDLRAKYLADKEGFAKEFPLRAAYFETLESLKESSKLSMREVLGSVEGKDPKKKAAFLNEQEPIGISIFKLKGALANLKEAATMRDMETSKRWLANFDYLQARLQSRLIYLYEYNYTLGQIRADGLPDLVGDQNGWRIGTNKKVAVNEQEAKALVKDTNKIWQRIQKEYPDTPWARLAEREANLNLGLVWRPKSD